MKARLIVNADDYGYFRCVSRGILQAAQEGIVTATGIMANGPHFRECVGWLREVPALDLGVHLNLTLGTPITAQMRRHLDRWGGCFPGKFTLAGAILRGAIPLAAVAAEWRAQIERCLEVGLRLHFLNGHEHVHMLPALHRLAHALAAHYGIVQVRHTRPDRRPAWAPGPLVRDLTLRLLAWHAPGQTDAPRLLGVAVSGRLDARALARLTDGLRAGVVYELMCHPGRYDPAEIRVPALLRYHDWQTELHALTAPGLRAQLAARGIELIGYRDLTGHTPLPSPAASPPPARAGAAYHPSAVKH